VWFIAAIIVGVGAAALVFWLRSRGVKITWYEILIGVVGIGLLLFSLQNYFGFTSEFESSAATTALLIMGLPGLILLAVAGVLVSRRRQKPAS